LPAYHHGDLRAALLAAARAALETDAGVELSLRSLATTVGVTPNAPYRHFPTKEALLAALAAQGFQELTASFAPSLALPGARRLKAGFQAYARFARENPGLYRLMFGRNLNPLSCDPSLGTQAQACFRALMAMMAELLDLSLDDPKIPGKAAIAWSLCHGAAMIDIDDGLAFLPQSERPDATSLTRTLASGLAD
jgi:AcrR family transcriptional regulator